MATFLPGIAIATASIAAREPLTVNVEPAFNAELGTTKGFLTTVLTSGLGSAAEGRALFSDGWTI